MLGVQSTDVLSLSSLIGKASEYWHVFVILLVTISPRVKTMLLNVNPLLNSYGYPICEGKCLLTSPHGLIQFAMSNPRQE